MLSENSDLDTECGKGLEFYAMIHDVHVDDVVWLLIDCHKLTPKPKQ